MTMRQCLSMLMVLGHRRRKSKTQTTQPIRLTLTTSRRCIAWIWRCIHGRSRMTISSLRRLSTMKLSGTSTRALMVSSSSSLTLCTLSSSTLEQKQTSLQLLLVLDLVRSRTEYATDADGHNSLSTLHKDARFNCTDNTASKIQSTRYRLRV